jgi:hypothetical protein
MIEEQLAAADVGVSTITGSTRTTAVGVAVFEAQASRIKILAIKKKLKKVRFMGISFVGQAFRLTFALAGYKPALRTYRFL